MERKTYRVMYLMTGEYVSTEKAFTPENALRRAYRKMFPGQKLPPISQGRVSVALGDLACLR